MAEITPVDVGMAAPDFRLPSSAGGEIGLAAYQGRMQVALFFVREYL
jgi:peroxiredoxin